jgi:hypothetical protein
MDEETNAPGGTLNRKLYFLGAPDGASTLNRPDLPALYRCSTSRSILREHGTLAAVPKKRTRIRVELSETTPATTTTSNMFL